MTAEIITLPVVRVDRDERTGNGAREALVAVAESLPNETGRNDAEAWADWILIELWECGYKIVPLEPVDV